MYGRLVTYSHSEDKVELEATARAAVISIVTNTPGYIAYGGIFQDDKVVSMSARDPRNTPSPLTRRCWTGSATTPR